MPIKAYIVGFIAGLAIFLLLDFLWLMILARNYYQQKIGYLMASKPFLPAAFIFYCLYVVGILYLIISPTTLFTQTETLIRGAVFGCMCYMTYDLSNWAAVKKWPAQLVVVDIVWGTFLTVCVTGGILAVLKMFNLIQIVV